MPARAHDHHVAVDDGAVVEKPALEEVVDDFIFSVNHEGLILRACSRAVGSWQSGRSHHPVPSPRGSFIAVGRGLG